ncbi:hypothetical protein RJT34_16729 [Clitoria ternatea]|uniref:Uncharacterized protein n=1 Tax=Clitoria ternatea TaxID=43366 RepID=A0AAN9PDZ9_CLITE
MPYNQGIKSNSEDSVMCEEIITPEITHGDWIIVKRNRKSRNLAIIKEDRGRLDIGRLDLGVMQSHAHERAREKKTLKTMQNLVPSLSMVSEPADALQFRFRAHPSQVQSVYR